MIILMQMQFEVLDALAVFWWMKLDYDVSIMWISEFWVRLLETDYFFTEPLSKTIFSAKIRARTFFSKKTSPPQNIKWTVHKSDSS